MPILRYAIHFIRTTLCIFYQINSGRARETRFGRISIGIKREREREHIYKNKIRTRPIKIELVLVTSNGVAWKLEIAICHDNHVASIFRCALQLEYHLRTFHSNSIIILSSLNNANSLFYNFVLFLFFQKCANFPHVTKTLALLVCNRKSFRN